MKKLSTAAYAAIMMVLFGLAAGCTNEGSATDGGGDLCTSCQALMVDNEPYNPPEPLACGNGIEEGTEECDSAVASANCLFGCVCASGFDDDPASAGCVPEVAVPVCGNGVEEAGEECDSAVLGSNCLFGCVCAVGFDNDPASAGCIPEVAPPAVCGNGVEEAGEECDSAVLGSNCLFGCICAVGFDNDPASAGCIPEVVPLTCGNGVLNAPEECDTVANCTLACTCAAGFDPAGGGLNSCVPEVAPPACGNGALNAPEECDSVANCTLGCTCAAGFDPAGGGLNACVPEPGPPEFCGNGLDDDGDGLTDCADPDCDGLDDGYIVKVRAPGGTVSLLLTGGGGVPLDIAIPADGAGPDGVMGTADDVRQQTSITLFCSELPFAMRVQPGASGVLRVFLAASENGPDGMPGGGDDYATSWSPFSLWVPWAAAVTLAPGAPADQSTNDYNVPGSPPVLVRYPAP